MLHQPTILIIDHKNNHVRIYANCTTKKQAKERGLKTAGDVRKFADKKSAVLYYKENYENYTYSVTIL